MTTITSICAAVLLLVGAAIAVYTLLARRRPPPPADDAAGWRRWNHAAYGRTAAACFLTAAGLLLAGLWPLALALGAGSVLNGVCWLGTHPALHALDRPPPGGSG